MTIIFVVNATRKRIGVVCNLLNCHTIYLNSFFSSLLFTIKHVLYLVKHFAFIGFLFLLCTRKLFSITLMLSTCFHNLP